VEEGAVTLRRASRWLLLLAAPGGLALLLTSTRIHRVGEVGTKAGSTEEATARGGRPARLPPPRFVTAAPPEADPQAAGYDPLALIRNGEKSAQLFAREPRDPVWAPVVERGIQATLDRDFARMIPDVQDATVECRTTFCRIAWNTAPGAAEPVGERAQYLLMVLYGGTSISRVRDRGEAFVAYAGGQRSPFAGLKGDGEAVVAQLQSRRSHILPQLRAGTVSELLTGPIQPEAWPEL
jgi:hypothetical protein